MVFIADMAIAFELIALVAGTALLAYACKEGIGCKAFVKAIAYITIVLSALTILCTGYYSLRYWEDGYFRKPAMMGAKHRSHGRRGPKGMKYRGKKHHGEGGKEMMRKRPEGEPGPGPGAKDNNL